MTITGTEEGGETLTASVTDIDGTVLPACRGSGQRANSAMGTFAPISGATNNTYTTVAADVTRYLRATASYTDPQGSGKSANAVTGQISASNNEPEFSSETSLDDREVPENSGVGTNVGSPLSTTDDDGDTLTYSFGTGGDESLFTIDSGTGQIKTKSGQNLQLRKHVLFLLRERARAGQQGRSQQFSSHQYTTMTISVSINLTDVNETPVIDTTTTAVSVRGKPDLRPHLRG